MTSSNPQTTSPTPSQGQGEEQTFRNYTSVEARTYQTHRSPYPPLIISTILDYHLSTTPIPNTSLLLDVGCGPGTSTRSFSPSFARAIGVDPSPAMIAIARSIPSTALSSSSTLSPSVSGITYLDGVSSSTLLNLIPSPIPHAGMVDMITVATAAHWFPSMSQFYASAHKLLRPGGTLAIWCHASFLVHADTTPNFAKISRILWEFETSAGPEGLAEFELPGNKLCRDMYDDLALPWTCDPPVRGFDEAGFQRVEFNRGGDVSATDGRFVRGFRLTIEEVGGAMDTASPVTRWRERFGEEVRLGKREDCVQGLKRRLREALREVGVDEGRELDCGSGVAIMLIKKEL